MQITNYFTDSRRISFAPTVTCRAGAMDLLGYTNESIMREVDALCQW